MQTDDTKLKWYNAFSNTREKIRPLSQKIRTLFTSYFCIMSSQRGTEVPTLFAGVFRIKIQRNAPTSGQRKKNLSILT